MFPETSRRMDIALGVANYPVMIFHSVFIISIYELREKGSELLERISIARGYEEARPIVAQGQCTAVYTVSATIGGCAVAVSRGGRSRVYSSLH